MQIGTKNVRSRNNKFDLLGNNKNKLERLQTSNNKAQNMNSFNIIQNENAEISQHEFSKINNNQIKFRSINVNINENQISNFNEPNSVNFFHNENIDKNLHVNLNVNLHSYIHSHQSAIQYMENSKNFSLNEANKNIININTSNNYYDKNLRNNKENTFNNTQQIIKINNTNISKNTYNKEMINSKSNNIILFLRYKFFK